jgi:hypothetical protein
LPKNLTYGIQVTNREINAVPATPPAQSWKPMARLPQIDPMVMLELLKAGVMTKDEVRERLGLSKESEK